MNSKKDKSAADDSAMPGLSIKDIFLLTKNVRNDDDDAAYAKIEEAVSEKLQRPFTLSDDMKCQIRRLFVKFNDKWQGVSRHEDKFFKKYSRWLSGFFLFEETPERSKKSSNMDWPSLEFSEASERTKRRKTEEFRAETSTEESSYPTQTSLLSFVKLDSDEVVQNVTLGSQLEAEHYKGSIGSISEAPFSPDAALSVIIESNLSKSNYRKIRRASRENCSTLFPSYNKVRQAKLQCYPLKSDITATEYSAEVKLQALLDHTIERILLTQADIINSMSYEEVRNLILISKWGCDGTSGQSAFGKKFTHDDGSKSDANIVVTSLVPLELLSVDQETHNTLIVWKNPRPSSPRFCRPIKIQFLNESTEAAVNKTEFIQQQETNLVPYETVINAKTIRVSFKLAFAVIDGKVCDGITDPASTQRCYVCRATSKDFNNINAVLKKEIDGDHAEFGLSTLHVWIRFFECCLDVGYKLDIKKWQARDSNDKESVKNRKVGIQTGFRLRLGLIVDQPKPRFGRSNDGNTARRFFENSAISASITGVNEDLIKRFHVILQALSSGHKINSIRFQDYALQTALDFVHLYPWYHMPTTVHKVLIHSEEIINSALLPIGQMSEEAQESSNKYIKKYRTDFAGKFSSRVKTMEDLFSRLLLTSDPYISSLRELPCKKFKSLLPEALQLLNAPSISTCEGGSSSYFPVESTDCESSDSSDDNC